MPDPSQEVQDAQAALGVASNELDAVLTQAKSWLAGTEPPKPVNPEKEALRRDLEAAFGRYDEAEDRVWRALLAEGEARSQAKAQASEKDPVEAESEQGS